MYYPEKNQAALLKKLANLSSDDYAIVCFCAEWCKTCAGFKLLFEALAAKYPQHAFVWVDIEEQEYLLIEEDIEDLPTVLIQNKKGTLYYGPLLPFAEHIERLLLQAQNKAQYIEAVADFEQLLIAAAQ